jgi:hypothetical protein
LSSIFCSFLGFRSFLGEASLFAASWQITSLRCEASNRTEGGAESDRKCRFTEFASADAKKVKSVFSGGVRAQRVRCSGPHPLKKVASPLF